MLFFTSCASVLALTAPHPPWTPARFHTTYPLELEGRISPTKFQETLNDINDALLGANSFGWAVFDNCLMVATFHLSLLVRTSHFEKVRSSSSASLPVPVETLFNPCWFQEINRLEALIESKNQEVWEPAGLRLRSPRKVAFMFVSPSYSILFAVHSADDPDSSPASWRSSESRPSSGPRFSRRVGLTAFFPSPLRYY